MSWPRAEPIETARLTLEPLRIEHAEEMFAILADHELYGYIGGWPPSVEELRTRCERQVVGHSPDGAHGWLNWVIRARETEAAAGMLTWLRVRGVDRFTAHIHPEHEASMTVAGRLGLSATDVVNDGETRWVSDD
jgi:RimJ/RimL family protein N-acetyltransferase